MRPTIAVPLGLAAAGAAVLGYAAGYEVRSFRLRRFEVPLLPPGARPLRVLHLSDLHMTPGQRGKQRWLRSLGDLDPDLVVNTGDNIAHPDAVPAVLDALAPLLDRPGVFVFGSNDYYAPVPKNPARYLIGHRKPPRLAAMDMLPWNDLRNGFQSAGWIDLSNAGHTLRVNGHALAVAGVDDPHIDRDRYDDVAGPVRGRADVSVGVLHAPYTRVLDRMAGDGYDLLLAGHTHGGQLRLPFYGTIVTNCDIDRRRARGLSRYPAPHPAPAGTPWLHVSAGLGTSPYAPVRFACPPEASLLTLVPQDGDFGFGTANGVR